jgi:hypothetical protein
MSLKKVISRKNLLFVGILKATYEQSRIRIRKSVVWIHGSGSVQKCHGSTTLENACQTLHEDCKQLPIELQLEFFPV